MNGLVLANASAVGEADGEARRHWRSVAFGRCAAGRNPPNCSAPVEFLPHDPPKTSDVLTSILRPARRTLRL